MNTGPPVHISACNRSLQSAQRDPPQTPPEPLGNTRAGPHPRDSNLVALGGELGTGGLSVPHVSLMS